MLHRFDDEWKLGEPYEDESDEDEEDGEEHEHDQEEDNDGSQDARNKQT